MVAHLPIIEFSPPCRLRRSHRLLEGAELLATGWGDQGFIKIQITDGTGVCGINSVVQYVDWADKY
jgi:hypothetical protein